MSGQIDQDALICRGGAEEWIPAWRFKGLFADPSTKQTPLSKEIETTDQPAEQSAWALPELLPCPDCGHEVSLRAKQCPSCGCPLETERAVEDPNACITCESAPRAPGFYWCQECLTSPEAMDIGMEKLAAKRKAGKERAAKAREHTSNWEFDMPESDHPRQVHCPKCGTTQVSANKKGFGLGKAVGGLALVGPVGLLGGFVGSGKVRITCLKCGHGWTAGG